MPTEPVRVVWLYGPPSVGKTTAGWEIYRSLPQPGRGYVDIDQLGMCYPARADDPHHERLKAHTLGAVLPNFSAYGAQIVIVSGVLDPALLPVYQDRAPAATFTVCRLTTALAELRRRHLARGENEAAVSEVIGWAQRLDGGRLPHVTVDTTSQSPSQVARRVVELTGLSTLPAAGSAVTTPPPVSSAAPGRVLFVIGPGSVGKSTIAWPIFTRARAQGTTGFVDLAQMGFLQSPAKDDPDRHRFKAANVAAVWSTFHAWGARTLIVNGRIPDHDVLRLYQQALPAADIVVVRLRAGPAELARRLMRQAQGHGVNLPGDRPTDWSPEQRERELDAVLADAEALDQQQLGDAVVDVDALTVEQAAQRGQEAAGWL